MERTQYDWEHQYLLTPQEYPIASNENHSTYDQFIQLRDTLIFSGKYYNNKAGKRLIVWDKWDWTTTNTIEVRENNYFKQSFRPNWSTDITHVTPYILWKYVSEVPAELSLQYQRWPLCCMINKDWHYRIIHKEEILLNQTQWSTPWTKKVFCYVDIYQKDENWVYKIPEDKRWWVAVFDWQWEFSKEFTWQTSWTQPNGSCSVTVSFVLWDIIQKMTAFGYMERELNKWDVLVLRMKDWPHDETTWEPTWENLKLQDWSNYWSIEYLDNPYKYD